MDRRGFLAAVLAVPLAASVPIRHWLPIRPPLTAFELLKRDMAAAMAAMSDKINAAFFRGWPLVPADQLDGLIQTVTDEGGMAGWLNADGTWTHQAIPPECS